MMIADNVNVMIGPPHAIPSLRLAFRYVSFDSEDKPVSLAQDDMKSAGGKYLFLQ